MIFIFFFLLQTESCSVKRGICDFFPAHAFREIGQSKAPVFPVEIIADVNKIILCSLQIPLFPLHRLRSTSYQEACWYSHSSDTRHVPREETHPGTPWSDNLPLSVPPAYEERDGPYENNGILYKFPQSLVSGKALPVCPAGSIILTVGIIVSALGIAEFIAVIDHGNTLTQQHHQKGIFDLAFPHLADGNLTGRAFHTAVPGIIIAASVLIAFAIGLVMFIIVAHQVIHGKSVLADHVIDHSMILAVMTDMPCCSLHHTFIAFSGNGAYLGENSYCSPLRNVWPEAFLCKMIKIKALEDQFCSGKDSHPEEASPG